AWNPRRVVRVRIRKTESATRELPRPRVAFVWYVLQQGIRRAVAERPGHGEGVRELMVHADGHFAGLGRLQIRIDDVGDVRQRGRIDVVVEAVEPVLGAVLVALPIWFF